MSYEKPVLTVARTTGFTAVWQIHAIATTCD